MRRSPIPQRRIEGIKVDSARYMSEIVGIHVAAVDAHLVCAALLGIPVTPTGGWHSQQVRFLGGNPDKNHSLPPCA